MQKTSKVTAVLQDIRQFKTKRGDTLHVHEITFENQDKGHYNSKTAECTKFTTGEETTYNIEPNGNFPDKITPFNPNNSGGGKKYGKSRNEQILIVYQNALTNAVNYHGGVDKASKVTITETAEYFAEFVLKNKYLSKDA